MTRDELEHIIRASADVTDQYEFIIVGSQSILGPIPNPPEVFTMSAEADIYPLQAPELADRIDGAIGEGSQFHQTYGYYAQGVGPETAVLPRGWINRVHRVQSAATNQRVGYCLDLPDLFMSKAAAGRDKDRGFCMANMPARPTCGSSTSSIPATRRCCACGTNGSGAIGRWGIAWASSSMAAKTICQTPDPDAQHEGRALPSTSTEQCMDK